MTLSHYLTIATVVPGEHERILSESAFRYYTPLYELVDLYTELRERWVHTPRLQMRVTSCLCFSSSAVVASPVSHYSNSEADCFDEVLNSLVTMFL